MEFLIGLLVILVLLLILGVDVFLIVQGILWLMELILAAMTLFFIVSIVFLLLGKWQDAEFQRVEKEGKFGHAVYSLSGTEQKNLYPAELILSKWIYRRKAVRVRTWERGKRHILFDRYSILIAALGLPLSAAGTVLLGVVLWYILH